MMPDVRMLIAALLVPVLTLMTTVTVVWLLLRSTSWRPEPDRRT